MSWFIFLVTQYIIYDQCRGAVWMGLLWKKTVLGNRTPTKKMEASKLLVGPASSGHFHALEPDLHSEPHVPYFL